ncbi:hypothetical protein GCM10011379_28100 [Filimonas zeae]|uniref:HNH nuclease domain-containing protein n=1 Tax=Filimonas zeae TaxID=1737353 RepID=A0A917MWS3_9BACT|nr:hypothetical protein GCM10011379_28100 [Filimonas zeae]
MAEDITETDDPSVLGEEAHIVAREEKGPRGKSTLTPEARDKYNNLMLLCQKHHKIIDDHEELYSVDKLHEIKNEHTEWVRTCLNPSDIVKQKDDETYATYVEEFVNLAGIEEWDIWSSYVLSGGQPNIFKDRFEELQRLNGYLLSRIWPNRYPKLEFAFKNFRSILNDFLHVFARHLDKSGEEMYYTEKFYNKDYHIDQKEYDILGDKFDYHVDLVQDLMCELTRGANFLIEQIRYFISPSFRTEKGLLLVTTGPDMLMQWTTVRLEFSIKDPEQLAYKDLRSFMTARENNTYHFGKGVSEDYFLGDKLREMMGE